MIYKKALTEYDSPAIKRLLEFIYQQKKIHGKKFKYVEINPALDAMIFKEIQYSLHGNSFLGIRICMDEQGVEDMKVGIV